MFVIQRHEARRLHHDFRLEHDGVLVSWALPKGVPTDPKRNHLAVPTEDHPMEYRFFEGTIPRGEYGAGQVEIWDSGTYEREKWRDEEVIAVLHGRPDGGLGGEPRRVALFRAGERDGKAQWMIHLMEAEPDARPERRPDRDRRAERAVPHRRSDASSAATAPERLSPMLATRGDAAELERLRAEDWAFEMKWDGMRAITTVDGSNVRILSRSGHDVTASYPELQSLAEAVDADHAVLDGEIVAFDAHGAPSFSQLQQRMGVTEPREVRRARQRVPVSLLLFDVLAANGRDCRSLSYRERRELLAEIVPDPAARLAEAGSASADPARAAAPVEVPEAFDGDAAEAMAASRRLGLEGVVAKRWDSRYRSGTRSPDWVKFPSIETAEVVVIGWRESTAEPSGLASVHVAFREAGELRYAGRVGTGFGAAERRRIRSRLARIERKTPAVEVPKQYREAARWVTPQLVAEVVYRGETGDGRLRHASWRGWRPDKSVEDLG